MARPATKEQGTGFEVKRRITSLTPEQRGELGGRVVIRGAKESKVTIDKLPLPVQLAAHAASEALSKKDPHSKVIIQSGIQGDHLVHELVLVSGANVDQNTGAIQLKKTPAKRRKLSRGLWMMSPTEEKIADAQIVIAQVTHKGVAVVDMITGIAGRSVGDPTEKVFDDVVGRYGTSVRAEKKGISDTTTITVGGDLGWSGFDFFTGGIDGHKTVVRGTATRLFAPTGTPHHPGTITIEGVTDPSAIRKEGIAAGGGEPFLIGVPNLHTFPAITSFELAKTLGMDPHSASAVKTVFVDLSDPLLSGVDRHYTIDTRQLPAIREASGRQVTAVRELAKLVAGNPKDKVLKEAIAGIEDPAVLRAALEASRYDLTQSGAMDAIRFAILDARDYIAATVMRHGYDATSATPMLAPFGIPQAQTLEHLRILAARDGIKSIHAGLLKSYGGGRVSKVLVEAIVTSLTPLLGIPAEPTSNGNGSKTRGRAEQKGSAKRREAPTPAEGPVVIRTYKELCVYWGFAEDFGEKSGDGKRRNTSAQRFREIMLAVISREEGYNLEDFRRVFKGFVDAQSERERQALAEGFELLTATAVAKSHAAAARDQVRNGGAR